MKSLLTILALGLLSSTLVRAEVPVNETLKEVVEQKFYTDGNNAGTGLGQVMKQLLGRALTRADYEVITLTSQSMRNPWAFAYRSEDKKICTAGDNSADFLILLRVKIKNPTAKTFGTYTFKVSAEQSTQAVHRAGLEIDNCADVSDDNGLFVISAAENLVSDYTYVEIAPPPAKASN